MLHTIRDICKATEGTLIQGSEDQRIKGIITRCNSVSPGQLYFDIKGGRGGDQNILTAIARGATALVISKHKKRLPFEDSSIAVVAVPKVLEAFWDCISYYRDQFNIPIVGITGTSGKTTTKEMMASVLRRKFNKVLKTTQNLNLPNYVPGHILRLTKEHQAAVFEIGMCQPGHISRQSRVIKPQIGIITNIGQGHVGNFKGKEDVIKEKGSIALGIPENGYLLVNADDPNSEKIDLTQFKGTVLKYGIEKDAEYKAYNIESGMEGVSFSSTVYGNDERFTISVPGRHNVYNALAVIAASTLLGIETDKIRRGLERYRKPKMRLQLVKGIKGSLLINDTYNANPDSVIAGLEVLKELSEGRTSIAVLGNMLEQGIYSSEAHQRVGRKVHELGIDYLYTIGALAKDIAVGALASGMDKSRVKVFNQRYQGSFYLKKHMPEGAVCLFKGSRAVYLDVMVDYLKDQQQQ